jgi:hypothetical protein
MAQRVYEMIDTYFESPILQKVNDEKDISIYMCRTEGGKYIVVTVDADGKTIGKRLSLINIPWKTFQTHEIAGETDVPFGRDLPVHPYTVKNSNTRLTCVYRQPTKDVYHIDGYHGCCCYVLHNDLVHHNQHTHVINSVESALESYRSVIMIL